MCNCNCSKNGSQPVSPSPTPGEEPKGYVCYQCNAFKEAPTAAPPPECCGKKMQEMD
jgi:hypothetical protein